MERKLSHKTMKIFNSFFSSAVKNLRILEFQEVDPVADKISHPTLKAILKYRHCISIIAKECK